MRGLRFFAPCSGLPRWRRLLPAALPAALPGGQRAVRTKKERPPLRTLPESGLAAYFTGSSSTVKWRRIGASNVIL